MSKKQKVAVYPGSFNPIHPGHIGIIQQATEVFDKVVVLIAENPEKTYKVGALTRAVIIKELLSQFPWAKKVTVDCTKDYLVKYCKEKGIKFVVRGLRNGTDLEYEKMQYEYSRALDADSALPPFNYVYFATAPGDEHLSSTGVRQFIKYANVAQLKKLYWRGGVLVFDDKVFDNLLTLYKE